MTLNEEFAAIGTMVSGCEKKSNDNAKKNSRK
jgi:hypothetical protein